MLFCFKVSFVCICVCACMCVSPVLLCNCFYTSLMCVCVSLYSYKMNLCLFNRCTPTSWWWWYVIFCRFKDRYISDSILISFKSNVGFHCFRLLLLLLSCPLFPVFQMHLCETMSISLPHPHPHTHAHTLAHTLLQYGELLLLTYSFWFQTRQLGNGSPLPHVSSSQLWDWTLRQQQTTSSC